MNRGQFRGLGVCHRLWLALCLVVCVAAPCGVSAAASRQPSAQFGRSWENYFAATILPSGRAIVAGDKGLIMVSDDRGKTWRRQQLTHSGKFEDLYSVAFDADGGRGWVVGDNGSIFSTDDRGTTWKDHKTSGPAVALLKVAIANAQTVCVSGEHGAIGCTTDGGANWRFQKFGDIVFFDIAFVDPNNGWAVGEFATLLHTKDGGRTWKIEAGGDPMQKADPYFALGFDGARGLAVGLGGKSATTNDGGKTWKPFDIPVDARSLYTVAAVPSRPDEFYVAGENGVAALIADGRASQVASGTSNAITSAAFSPRFALAVGLSGTLITSDDGGQHWRSPNGGGKELQTRAQ